MRTGSVNKKRFAGSFEFESKSALKLHKYCQSFWLDNINCPLITSGELKRLVEEDGLRGITSNPTIFEKAITDFNGLREFVVVSVR